MRAHRAEIDAIAASPEPPTFENTVAALDRSGRDLARIERLFCNLAASETSPALQAVEREMAPRLAAHDSAIHLHAALFARIDALHGGAQTLGLDARAAAAARARAPRFRARRRAAVRPRPRRATRAIVERLAALTTRFSQNVLADEAELPAACCADERDLAGLPRGVRAAAREAAQQRGEPDAWVITLSRSLIVPFLTFSDRRDLREQAFTAWTRRGEHDGAHDNRPIAREILALRNELARLHGYRNYADYALVDRMAGTPAAVAGLLDAGLGAGEGEGGRRARRAARRWRAARRDARRSSPGTGATTPRRCARRATTSTTPSSSPTSRSTACWRPRSTARSRLFGVRFVERPDLHAYHPDVRVFEVRGRDGDG